MNIEEADAKAKELYGPKAFAEEDQDFRICLDTSWSEGKKFYKTARLLGWGNTWEEAFALAEKKYPNLHSRQEYKQLSLLPPERAKERTDEHRRSSQ